MTLLSIPALVMAVIAFYVGGYHLFIFSRRPGVRVDLTFALASICIGFYDLFCVGLYNVNTPEAGVLFQRWQLITLALFSIAMIWFVVDYTGMKERVGPRIFSALFLLFALIGFFDQSGLAWTDVPLVKIFNLPPGNWKVTYFEMEFGPAMLLEGFALMAFYLYLYAIAVHYYWKRNPARAKPLVLAIALFMAGMTEDVFVAFGFHNFIYTIEYAFVGMILMMAYVLSADIVDLSRFRQELGESEKRFCSVMAQAADAIFIHDLAGNILDCNQRAWESLGYSREELQRLNVQDIDVQISNNEQVGDYWRNMSLGDTVTLRGEHRRKDGTTFPVEIRLVLLEHENSRVILAMAHDITERRRTENEFREKEARFRAFFEHVTDYALVLEPVDGDLIIVDLNESACRMHGYTREEVIGKSLRIFDRDIDPIDEQRLSRIMGGETVEFEVIHRRKDGATFPVEITARLIRVDNKPYIFSIERDISERQRAEKEKARLEADLRQAHKMEALGTMAGGIANEFNNILAIISGNASMALSDIPEKNSAREDIEEVLKASDRARNLVSQILVFRGHDHYELKLQYLQHVVRDILKLLRPSIPTTVSIKESLDPGCKPVMADSNQVHQLLMHLCNNSVQAMDEKGTLEVQLVEIEGVFVRLSVIDSGAGMTDEAIEHIFDPFYTTWRDRGNTGMGLSIVHGIVENHLGEIAVESQPGQGATFHVYFPVTEKTVQTTADEMEVLAGGSEHILFVDDEKPLTVLGQRILSRFGYRVTTMTDSTEALRLFRDDPDGFDLVITDQTMPNMTGTKLVQELLKIKPDLPVILCTGFSTNISEANAGELGVGRFMKKPYDRKLLAEAVRELLDARS